MKSQYRGSATFAFALFASLLTFTASAASAESQFFQDPKQADQLPAEGAAVTEPGGALGALSSDLTESSMETIAAGPTNFVATAYSLRGRTASGRMVAKGIIAADPKVLPLGSRVRIEAGFFSGDYLVADTGGAIRGKIIDIWTPSTREALRFGRRKVKLTVLSYGPRKSASKKAKSQRPTTASLATSAR